MTGPAASQWLTIKEVAAELHVSYYHVYELVRTGRLPHADFGTGNKQLIRVHRADLDAYIRRSETR